MNMGYIVVDETSIPLCIYHGFDNAPRAGVLSHGDEVTVFPNYKSAWRAIQRSKIHELRQGFNWNTWGWRTMRLVAY